MTHLARLIATVTGLWIVLSGMFKVQFIVLGILSIALVCWLAVRMRVLEHRGQPIYFSLLPMLRYCVWLLREILQSNIEVVRRILRPNMRIEPRLRAITSTPHTDIGRAIYANSITLTPGTTAISFTPPPDEHVLVHALHVSSLDHLEKGGMADEVCRVERHIPTVPPPR